MAKTKEEFKKQVIEKLKVKEDKFDDVWNQKEEEMKKRGYDGDDLLNMTMRKVNLFLRKASQEKDFDFIVIGYSPITDYGADRKKIKAEEAFSKDPEKAIADGLCNSDGVAIWPTGHKKNKPIEPEKERNRSMYCLAKSEGDAGWKLCTIELKGTLLDQPILKIGKKYRGSFGIKKETQEKYDGNRLSLYANQGLKIDELEDVTGNLKKLVKDFLSEYIMPNFESVKDKAKNNPEWDSVMIFKVDVMKTNETSSGINNSITILDEDADYEESMVSCWIAEDIPLNIHDESTDVIMIGNARTRQDRNDENKQILNIDIYGFFPTDKRDIKTEENTPTIPERQETTNDGASIEEVLDSPEPEQEPEPANDPEPVQEQSSPPANEQVQDSPQEKPKAKPEVDDDW